MQKEFAQNPFKPSLTKEKQFAKKTGKTMDEVKTFLMKQDIYQIYLPRPKYIPRPTASFKEYLDLNDQHQADLIYLPHDNGYKYALTIVDVATRYKCAIPLKTKSAKSTREGFEKAYSGSVLKQPKKLLVDRGKEFLGGLDKYLSNTQIIQANQKGLVSIVERFNRTLAEEIFLKQYKEELNADTRYNKWVEMLPTMLQKFNSQYTRLIKMSPNKAVKQGKNIKQYASSPIPKDYKPPQPLYIGDRVRYLYKAGEAENDTKKRATDPNYSMTVYNIKRNITFPNGFVYYYLDSSLEYLERRHFLREELLYVGDPL